MYSFFERGGAGIKTRHGGDEGAVELCGFPSGREGSEACLDGCEAIRGCVAVFFETPQRSEFAIKDGVPYAIDFTNPAPDMDRWSVTEHFFKICVEEMARFAIKVVREGRQPEVRSYKWAEFLPGGARANELGPVARNGLTVGGGVGVRL